LKEALFISTITFQKFNKAALPDFSIYNYSRPVVTGLFVYIAVNKRSMITFKAVLKKFDEKGEKTGWTYIEIPQELAEQLMPGNKKAFRVKGTLDNFPIKQVSLVPMGGGNFILAVNENMRRGLKKRKGAEVIAKLSVDKEAYVPAAYITDCIADDPAAWEYYQGLPASHRNYFTKWVESAKTPVTRENRLGRMVNALARKWDYAQMIRAGKEPEFVAGDLPLQR
jgi:hypothetical protein